VSKRVTYFCWEAPEIWGKQRRISTTQTLLELLNYMNQEVCPGRKETEKRRKKSINRNGNEPTSAGEGKIATGEETESVSRKVFCTATRSG